MSIIRSICMAFAMYSKLPVPRVAWKKENMKYALCFFPLIGLIIGTLCMGWYFLSASLDKLTEVTRVGVIILIPLVISGGIHIDGYMDVMDALHSWADRKKKLEIMKDPHVGAFAVIHVILYYLLMLIALSQINTPGGMCVFSAGFCLSRILSAISALTFPAAKKEGTLYEFTSASSTGVVRFTLIMQLLICAVVMLCANVILGGAVLVANIGLMVFAYYLFVKEFGGVTGDTCGFLSSLVELITALVVGLLSVVG
ncbi:MAG: adenosylcobinamide-GDP ribazoletransferase [Lachnospiraceae bacterium]|nr:adenosylcobinamide-GDP ribazoletransferase [Lachnospiraceae bacterium]